MDKTAGNIEIRSANAIIILKVILYFLLDKNSETALPIKAQRQVPTAVTNIKTITIIGSACQILEDVSKYAAIELITTVTPLGLTH